MTNLNGQNFPQTSPSSCKCASSEGPVRGRRSGPAVGSGGCCRPVCRPPWGPHMLRCCRSKPRQSAWRHGNRWTRTDMKSWARRHPEEAESDSKRLCLWRDATIWLRSAEICSHQGSDTHTLASLPPAAGLMLPGQHAAECIRPAWNAHPSAQMRVCDTWMRLPRC